MNYEKFSIYHIKMQISNFIILFMDYKYLIRFFFTALVCLLTVAALLITYILKRYFNIFQFGFITVGAYGLIVFFFIFVQNFIAIYNKHCVIQKFIQRHNQNCNVSIQVVGYREDPQLFKCCLVSIKRQKHPNILRIVVGIDGNQEQDLSMQQIFFKVFPEGKAVRLNQPLCQMQQQERIKFQQYLKNYNSPVCISQPHRGKRQIMYTAFHAAHQDAELVMLTDSDTYLNDRASWEMARVINGHDNYRKQLQSKGQRIREIGAVTGKVLIWNQENMITYLSALRYWYAFSVQRASDSAFGVVNCVSGPLGMYKKKYLDQIKQKWINQTFMGQKCTFGDDRHLSNLILSKGLAIYYTPYATCETDTPAELMRWIAQQTRWAKSYYREFLFSVKGFCLHPVWMAFQMVFQMVYTFFILVTLIYLVTLSLNDYLITVSMILIMGYLRAFIAMARARNLNFIFYIFYILLYVLFLIPSKLFALLTIWNNDWGTSARLYRYNNIIKALHALLWAAFFIVQYVYYLVKHLNATKNPYKETSFIATGVLVFATILLQVIWLIYESFFLLPKAKSRFNNKIRDVNKYLQGVKSTFYIQQVTTDLKLAD